jgi:hypothetical protein
MGHIVRQPRIDGGVADNLGSDVGAQVPAGPPLVVEPGELEMLQAAAQVQAIAAGIGAQQQAGRKTEDRVGVLLVRRRVDVVVAYRTDLDARQDAESADAPPTCSSRELCGSAALFSSRRERPGVWATA